MRESNMVELIVSILFIFVLVAINVLVSQYMINRDRLRQLEESNGEKTAKTTKEAEVEWTAQRNRFVLGDCELDDKATSRI